MTVKSCEKVEKSQVALTIEVNAAEFEAAVEKAYQKMRRKINVPGFRPGKPTADFIQKVINKIIVFGSVYLGIVALLPIIAGNLMEGVKNLAIGGTSVIIVVGVALETVKALEAQMLMRHYKGFLD